MRTPYGLIGLFLALAAGIARAEMSLDLETSYAEALVAYHSGSYALAAKLLDRLSATGPDQDKILELRALALQGAGDLQQALEIYRVLLQSVSERTRSGHDSAIYDFQAGVILFQKRRFLESRLHLERALDQKYNTDFGNYLLGRICYELGDLRAATIYLQAALQGANEDVKPSSGYYLGLVALRQQRHDDAVDAWRTAREQIDAKTGSADATAEMKSSYQKTGEAIDAAVDSELSGHFDARIGFVTGYDSNPLLMSSTDEAQIGQDTFYELFRYGLSYSTSANAAIQVTPYLRGFTNFNTNGSTNSAQFLNQQFGLVLTGAPLGTIRFGLELNGNFLARYQAATSSFPTELYGAGGVLFLEDREKDGAQWEARAGASYQDYVTDTRFSSALAMTGEDYTASLAYRKENHRTWWNPQWQLAFYDQQTQGTEWQSIGGEVVLGNAFEISHRWTFTPLLGLGLYEYPQSSRSSRTDAPYRLGYDLRFQWSDNLRLSTQLSYFDDGSSYTALYEYNRLRATLCVDYSF